MTFIIGLDYGSDYSTAMGLILKAISEATEVRCSYIPTFEFLIMPKVH
jgi:hypothetical protein